MVCDNLPEIPVLLASISFPMTGGYMSSAGKEDSLPINIVFWLALLQEPQCLR